MEKQQLVDRLKQLHVELSQAERVDPEALDLLETLTDDIERVLQRRGAVSAAEMEPVASGLRDLLLKFEAAHPQFAAAVGKVADALAAIGI